MNDEVFDLQQKINQKETRNAALEEELKKKRRGSKNLALLIEKKNRK